MKLAATAIALMAALVAAPSAHACRVEPAPADVLRRQYDAIVIVTVTQVDDRTKPGMTPLWNATGQLKAVVAGQPGAGPFSFGRRLAPGSCEFADPYRRVPAQPGEDWVLYLESGNPLEEPGQLSVDRAYRMIMMRDVDPRLSRSLTPPTPL